MYIGDYLKDTTHLSAAEHGAYLLLIMTYWQKGELPTDDAKLQRISRMTELEWKSSRDTVAEFFQPGWKHPRIEAEMIEAAAKHEKLAAAGSAGGKKSAKVREIKRAAAAKEASLASSLATGIASSDATSDATSLASSDASADDSFDAWSDDTSDASTNHNHHSTYPGSGDTLDKLPPADTPDTGKVLSLSERALAAMVRR